MKKEIIFYDEFSNYLKYLENKLKPTTLRDVERTFIKHILPFYQNKNIYDLNDQDFLNWQNYIKNLNLSDSFNKNVQAIFRNFYNYLERIYKIQNFSNIYGNFKTFKVENSRKIEVWTLSEYKKFIKVVDEQIYKSLFDLLIKTGLRIGEALALRFYDLDKQYLCINKTITKTLFHDKKLELEPKTKKSIRKVRIDRKLYKEIENLRKYYIKLFGECQDNFYIFGGKNSLSQTTIKRKKDFWCKKANVKQIRIHDFRHTHATFLYNHNIKVKLIQERLGHSDISTTLNTYVHTNVKDEKRVLRTLNFLRFRF